MILPTAWSNVKRYQQFADCSAIRENVHKQGSATLKWPLPSHTRTKSGSTSATVLWRSSRNLILSYTKCLYHFTRSIAAPCLVCLSEGPNAGYPAGSSGVTSLLWIVKAGLLEALGLLRLSIDSLYLRRSGSAVDDALCPVSARMTMLLRAFCPGD